MTQKIQSVFVANSTYSLLTHLMYRAANGEQSVDNFLKTTLLVAGPAIRDIPVLPAHKVVWTDQDRKSPTAEDRSTQSAAMHQAFWRQYDSGLPVYLNARVPFADNLLDYADTATQNPYKKTDIRIVSDGLSDHDTFPMLVQRPSVTMCYSATDILSTLRDPKIQTFDVLDLWQRTPAADRKTLSTVFNISAETLDKASSKPVLVVTQPLSEDNMMAEADKIELYRRIISVYGADQVIIKPHPREKTDWTTVFPEAPVIPKQVPMELLARLAKLERIATFFSTSAFGTLPDDRVDFYAKDFAMLKSYHPETVDERGFKSVAVSDVEEKNCKLHACNWLRLPDSDGRFYRSEKIATQQRDVPTDRLTPVHTRA